MNENEEWKSIETAPKDGTEILVSDGNTIRIVQWKEYQLYYPNCKPTTEWCIVDSGDEQNSSMTYDNPTMWRELPALPKTKAKQ